jgi:hypothetical protein
MKNTMCTFLVLAALFTFSGCKKTEDTATKQVPRKQDESRLKANAVPGVTISGNKFYANGKQIFFNGINTAWQKQSDYSLDFLDRNYDPNWWNTEFTRYNQNKINLVRFWIHGSGAYSPGIDGNGYTLSPSTRFLSDMDGLVQKAVDWNLYIMPTFWSFDMAKGSKAQQFRNIITDINKTNSYINNFLIPFVRRYNANPNIIGYDLCNEPEHIWRDADCGRLDRNRVIRFLAMCAAAIHKNSTKPVTVGSMWICFNSDRYIGYNTYTGDNRYTGNNYSNASLQAQFNDSKAYLDFWSPHWYAWQSSSGPFATTIGNWLDNGNKPALIGETYGGNVSSSTPNNSGNYNITMANYYKQSYWNGYAGVCAWKNPWENDGYGTFNGIASGTNAFYAAYPALVYP